MLCYFTELVQLKYLVEERSFVESDHPVISPEFASGKTNSGINSKYARWAFFHSK